MNGLKKNIMKHVNTLENTLLKAMVLKYPTLENHLPLLKVKTRTNSAQGAVIELIYEDNTLNFDETLNALFSDGKNIAIPELKKGLSYVIDITCGEITGIELNTYEEKWNGKMSAFELVEVER